MARVLISILLSQFILLIDASNTLSQNKSEALQDNYGFKEFKFEMTLDQFEECFYLTLGTDENEGAEVCVINNSNRGFRIVDMKIDRVVLYFVEERLLKIVALTGSPITSSQMNEALISAFGRPDQTNINNNNSWLESRTMTTCWLASNFSLCHHHATEVYIEGVGRDDSFRLIYEHNSYEEELRIARENKYSPDDF